MRLFELDLRSIIDGAVGKFLQLADNLSSVTIHRNARILPEGQALIARAFRPVLQMRGPLGLCCRCTDLLGQCRESDYSDYNVYIMKHTSNSDLKDPSQ